MNVWWRTLLTIWRAKVLLRRRGPIPPDSVGRVRLRTLPTDLDLLIRTGIWDAMNAEGWYAVVASETVTFRKSLQLWQRFTVESRLYGHDDKAVYQIHRAVVDGEIYAEMIVRARFLRRTGGVVNTAELFEALHRPDNLPPLPQWIVDWAAGAALPSTKAPAPSIWE